MQQHWIFVSIFQCYIKLIMQHAKNPKIAFWIVKSYINRNTVFKFKINQDFLPGRL